MDTSNEENEIGFDATSSSLHNTKKSLLSTNPHGLQFQFRLEDLIQFIFPKNLQHPLTNARLFIFALYGPLDQNGKLRSGRGGQHVLMEYELDEMCMQIEREDLIQVYMHRPRDMATLVTSEQEAIINQADAHLKRAKGRAMLPQLRQEEIEDLFQDFSRDAEGKISFHEAQEMLHKFREDRVKRFKLVYPDLTNKNKSSLNATRKNSVESSSLDTFQNQIAQATGNITMGSLASTSLADSKNQKHKTVAPYIAPQTMFQKNKGCNNADLLEVTMKQLSKHGNKILDIDAKSSTHVISNVKLLREIPPKFENPYEGTREKWSTTAGMKGVGLGSGVNTLTSTTTWKRKYTSY